MQLYKKFCLISLNFELHLACNVMCTVESAVVSLEKIILVIVGSKKVVTFLSPLSMLLSFSVCQLFPSLPFLEKKMCQSFSSLPLFFEKGFILTVSVDIVH